MSTSSVRRARPSRARESSSSRSPARTFKARLTGFGMSDAMAQGMLDMMLAKDNGLDNAEPRTPRSTTPTGFRQWCAEVLKPAVLF
jgi:hypothetical protein